MTCTAQDINDVVAGAREEHALDHGRVETIVAAGVHVCVRVRVCVRVCTCVCAWAYMYCVCDQGGQPAAMMQQCLVHANGEPITFAADIIVPMRVSTNKKKVKAVHVTVQSAGRCTD